MSFAVYTVFNQKFQKSGNSYYEVVNFLIFWKKWRFSWVYETLSCGLKFNFLREGVVFDFLNWQQHAHVRAGHKILHESNVDIFVAKKRNLSVFFINILCLYGSFKNFENSKNWQNWTSLKWIRGRAHASSAHTQNILDFQKLWLRRSLYLFKSLP